jgi:hypothetical protein
MGSLSSQNERESTYTYRTYFNLYLPNGCQRGLKSDRWENLAINKAVEKTKNRLADCGRFLFLFVPYEINRSLLNNKFVTPPSEITVEPSKETIKGFRSYDLEQLFLQSRNKRTIALKQKHKRKVFLQIDIKRQDVANFFHGFLSFDMLGLGCSK